MAPWSVEATSDYWKHFQYLLAEDLKVAPVNARSIACPVVGRSSRTRLAWSNSGYQVPVRHV